MVTARDLLVPELLLSVSADILQFRNAVNGVNRQAKTIGLVVDREFHRGIDVALFFVPAHVDVGVAFAPV